MATWIELRCENRGATCSPNRCLSDDNAGPMDMANDDQKSVLAVLKRLGDEARREGWVRTRDGWVCSVCNGVELANNQPKGRKSSLKS